jgi:hypothetical protein
MRIRANLQAVVLDPRQVPDLDAAVKLHVEEAARRWVRAALEIVPDWSGASRATFQALASAVGEHVSIDVSANAPDRIGLGRLYSRGGVEKTEVASYRFFYETSLRYLIANETKKVAPGTHGLRGKLIEPTPYKFREAGNAAAQAYLAGISAKLPIYPLQGKKI